jgi:hypothetical protein
VNTWRIDILPVFMYALAVGLAPVCRAGSDVEIYNSLIGNARARETSSCRCFEPGPQQVLPDLIQMSLSGWAPTSPATDLFTGNVTSSGAPHFSRIQVVFQGLVNPPGGLGLSSSAPYAPFQFGPSPLYGFFEFDVDRDSDTGAEMPGTAANRFLANAARFGARPRGSRGERAARSSADLYQSWDQAPQVCRSGADFSLVFCGCFPVTVVGKSDPDHDCFSAGDTWTVQGRFFQRAGAYIPACNTAGGSVMGAYDPIVKVRFSHDQTSDRTTVTLVYPIDQVGSQQMMGSASAPPLNTSINDAFSLQEAIQELINRAQNLSGVNGLTRASLQEWQDQTFNSDMRDPTRWRVSALVGTTYQPTAPADEPYVWTDLGFDLEFGDMDGDGVKGSLDQQYVRSVIDSLDGVADRDVDHTINGRVEIPDFGFAFDRADINNDGVIDQADIALLGPPCVADFDRSGTANLDDIFIYLNAWFAGEPRCNVDGIAGLTIDDLFVFINLWFAGC